MGLYLTYAKLAFKERYAYKVDFYFSSLASILIITIQISVWMALYNTSSANKVVSLGQMLLYVLFSSIIFTLTKSDASVKIGQKVEDGSIISDFIRPISLKQYIFAEDIGNNMFELIFSSIPAVIFVLIFFPVQFNGTMETVLLASISILLGLLISFHIKYMIGLFTFWLESSWFIPFFIGAIFDLFSGSVVPLWYYPDWLKSICAWLPLRLIFFEPISILLGRYHLNEITMLLVQQIIWLGILIVLERAIWSSVKTKVVVHGG